jgi:hypothetical protein
VQTLLGVAVDNSIAALLRMENNIRCNICDEIISSSSVSEHLAGRNHAVRKKVAEFHEMNAQVGSRQQQQYPQHEISIVRAWIRDLHNYDYLSTGRT